MRGSVRQLSEGASVGSSSCFSDRVDRRLWATVAALTHGPRVPEQKRPRLGHKLARRLHPLIPLVQRAPALRIVVRVRDVAPVDGALVLSEVAVHRGVGAGPDEQPPALRLHVAEVERGAEHEPAAPAVGAAVPAAQQVGAHALAEAPGGELWTGGGTRRCGRRRRPAVPTPLPRAPATRPGRRRTMRRPLTACPRVGAPRRAAR